MSSGIGCPSCRVIGGHDSDCSYLAKIAADDIAAGMVEGAFEMMHRAQFFSAGRKRLVAKLRLELIRRRSVTAISCPRCHEPALFYPAPGGLPLIGCKCMPEGELTMLKDGQ